MPPKKTLEELLPQQKTLEDMAEPGESELDVAKRLVEEFKRTHPEFISFMERHIDVDEGN